MSETDKVPWFQPCNARTDRSVRCQFGDYAETCAGAPYWCGDISQFGCQAPRRTGGQEPRGACSGNHAHMSRVYNVAGSR